MQAVLVVDDDENYRELVVLTLEDECGVLPVHGFAGAAALLRHLDGGGAEPPRLVLLDLHMPDMDGLELMRQIRQRHPGLPVAFLSGAARPEERAACLAAGATAFLQKPAAYPELVHALGELVRSLPGSDPSAASPSVK
ncbi:MAG TPA: response regulator [Ramlibacter sp.]|uniref:response regulator n=1 Tax=Ramlibacter sp. TaxID=1917967 RepID=UPI002D809E79|nr:response regulator [Ramlibacter sp.]HET8745127.1 response regulator [Ramlibacter sp.]